MMSKFEMALLTVTVVGTLVAWPALQQASFVRPTDGATSGRRPAKSAHRSIRHRGRRQPGRDSFFQLRARLGNAVDATPSRGTVAFRRDIVRNVHGQ